MERKGANDPGILFLNSKKGKNGHRLNNRKINVRSRDMFKVNEFYIKK